MDLGLKGKSVVVTGGSKGIGFAAAEAFLKEGAKVAICSRHEEERKQPKSFLSMAKFIMKLSMFPRQKVTTLLLNMSMIVLAALMSGLTM